MSSTGGTAADALATIRAIWSSRRGEVIAQVDEVEAALDAAAAGGLDDDRRLAAERQAHKLAGSVGTFGFELGSQRARELERALGRSSGLEASELPRLVALVQELRTELAGEVDFGPEVDTTASPSLDAAADARWARATGALDLLVIADPERAMPLEQAARDRGLTVSSESSIAAARMRLAEASVEIALLDLGPASPEPEALDLLAEAASDRPVLVLYEPTAAVDRVAVARRGGRGFLPRSLAPTEVLAVVVEQRLRLRAQRMTVLVCDDDASLLAAVRGALEAGGLRVETQLGSDGFWEALEATLPDLVVLDYLMPGINGPDLCRALRSDRRWETLPIVFLTVRTESESIREIFEAGGDDYIPKPFVVAELLARITGRLDRVRLYRTLAETDPLTGLQNRRSFTEILERQRRMADRIGLPMTFAILDVDEFKTINDRFGHATGDTILREISTTLQQTFRSEDVIGRWGGDELVVGMYAMGLDDALERISELLGAVRELRFSTGQGETSVTLSAGIAEYPTDGVDLPMLYRAADVALYEAKRAGRDRVNAAVRA